MATAKVYRPEHTWKGVDGELDDWLIGEVTGVVLGGPAPEAIPRFPGLVSTEGMVGIPFTQASGIVVGKGDRLIIDNVLYLVSGPRQWTNVNTLTGTAPTHYWVEVQSSH